MDRERWQRIERVYDSAVELKPSDRQAYLEKACAGDDELRREVEKLISFDRKAGRFMESPALDVAAKALARSADRGKSVDFVGQTILHYKVMEKVGEGGMGVVYKALDTHLKRPVAVKVLLPERVTDPERRLRFVQEARAASALNHPNIVTIYDIDQAGGTDFIAMEYVSGRTLGELIPRKKMRLGDTLKYAIQIADALAAAHAAGIVHRDLKPANVMVTDKGLVKVLDFGLAKLTEPAESDEFRTTETLQPRTEEGTIVGTVAYMSPEQAEGKKVDARSDIFSLGSVLYEMVTGHRAFEGDSRIATLSAILHQEPKPVSTIARAAPADLEKLIERCLRKDPEQRIQHVGDVKLLLAELKQDLDSGRLQVTPAAVKRVSPLRLAGVVVAVVILVAAGWYWLGQQGPTEPEATLTAVPLTSYPGYERSPRVSPDGNYVAFEWTPAAPGANCDIYIKQIGVDPPDQRTTDPAVDFSPAWSPNELLIAFLRQVSTTKVALMITPQRGAGERALGESASPAAPSAPLLPADAHQPHLAWTPDSKWIALRWGEADKLSTGLFLFNVETAETRGLTTGADNAPAFSPDGRTIAFNREGYRDFVCLLRLTSDYLPQGEPERIARAAEPYLRNFGMAWSSDGRDLVFSSGNTLLGGLWRVVAATSARSQRLGFTSNSASEPAISRQGNRLAYVAERSDANIWRVELSDTAESRSGVPARLIASTREERDPAYSPDGRRIAYVSGQSGPREVWICESNGSNPVQLTRLAAVAVYGPKWSPDGRNIAFHAASSGRVDIYTVSANGAPLRRLTSSPAPDKWPSWSRDNQSIYFVSGRSGSSQIWKMPATGGDAVQITPDDGETRDIPQESPDGRYVYYEKGWPARCSVWRLPVGGGEESKVLDSVHNAGGWTVGREGIYFITTPDAEGRSEIRFYKLATGEKIKILTIDRNVYYRIAVSPDERTILYAQYDQAGSDLMLVENFR